jgi:hypothetical protein
VIGVAGQGLYSRASAWTQCGVCTYPDLCSRRIDFLVSGWSGPHAMLAPNMIQCVSVMLEPIAIATIRSRSPSNKGRGDFPGGCGTRRSFPCLIHWGGGG